MAFSPAVFCYRQESEFESRPHWRDEEDRKMLKMENGFVCGNNKKKWKNKGDKWNVEEFISHSRRSNRVKTAKASCRVSGQIESAEKVEQAHTPTQG